MTNSGGIGRACGGGGGLIGISLVDFLFRGSGGGAPCRRVYMFHRITGVQPRNVVERPLSFLM